MKKLLSLLFVSTLLLSVGCSAEKTNVKEDTASTDKKYKIGITQSMEHPALDDARIGFEEELKAQGIEAEILYKNAQGDVPTSTSIAQKFMDEKVDLIYAVSTQSAQAAKQVTKDTPIIFAAVTDPEQSELTGKNITGVSDKTPIKEHLQLFQELDPNIKKIGIIYSTSETNSQIQVRESKEIAKQLGLKIVDVGINNINDMPQGIEALLQKSDAIYMITDNLVAQSLDLLTAKVNAAKKVMVMGYVDSSDSAKNVFLSNGVSYKDFGKQAGAMAAKVLKDGVYPSDIPVAYAEKTYNTVSLPVVKEIGFDENHPVIQAAEKIE